MVSAAPGILKKTWTFLLGEWGTPVGKAFKEAKKLDPKTSIFNFEWGKTYTSEVAKLEAAKAAGAKGGLFSKLLGKLGPILTAVFFLPKIISAFKNDGITEGLKETAKAAVSLIGFAIGGVIVGMLGLTGVLGIAAGLLIPLATSFVLDKGSNMILGESKADQRALLAENKGVNINPDASYNGLLKNDPSMAGVMRVFNNRNNMDGYCSNIQPFMYGNSNQRTLYYA